MKKITLLFIAMFVGMVSVHAGNTVTVSEALIPQGRTGSFNIELNNDDGFTAFQMRLTLPEGIQFVSVTAGNRFTNETHMFSDATNGQVTTFALLSAKNLLIEGNSGTLFTVTVSADESLPVGSTLTATLGDIVLATPAEEQVTPDDINFMITISDRIVLDETATTAPEEATNANVQVKRTINAGEWSTIVLPFAMTEEQVKAAFGDDVELGDFAGYETTEDDDENVVGITVNFEAATAIEANHPYIIKVSSKVTQFDVDGVDIEPEDEPTVATIKRTKKQWSEMVGTYVANTVIEEQMLFLSENKFWYSNGATKMKAFRAYFDFYDVLSEVDESAARITMDFDSETTAISDFTTAPASIGEGSVYDLQGRPVRVPARGVYIKNGKKVVIK